MESERTLILELERPVYGGLTIGRHKGKIVMVSGPVLPGETAEVTLDNEKKGYFTASVKKIIEPSPDRIQPFCKFFGSCGGCHFQHIDYKRQVQIKNEVLKDCLKRIAGVLTEPDKPITGNKQWNYRIRGQFKASRGNIGFYRGKTRDVIDIDNCPLMSEELNAELTKIRPICNGLDISEIHISKGDRSTVLLRTSRKTLSRELLDSAASKFLNAGYEDVCIQSKAHDSKCMGTEFITLDHEGFKYTVSSLSFLQSNWGLNRVVAGLIRQSLSPLNNKKILDLYSGGGNFSIPLAGGTRITAVEENPHSVEDGERNLKLNDIKDFKFIRTPAEKFNIARNFDIILLDPPRTGLAKTVIKKLLTSLPDRIVYVSCNPTTFARDLKPLKKNYDIESIRMIDLFPQTFHIESLAFLKRK